MLTPHGLSDEHGQGGGEFDKQIRRLATPTATDGRKWNAKTKEQRRLAGSSVRLCNEEQEDGSPCGGQLNPDWVEWLMGWPVGWTQIAPLKSAEYLGWEREPEGVPRTVRGMMHRADRLRAIGNGQVPAAAELAWEMLTKVALADAAWAIEQLDESGVARAAAGAG